MNGRPKQVLLDHGKKSRYLGLRTKTKQIVAGDFNSNIFTPLSCYSLNRNE